MKLRFFGDSVCNGQYVSVNKTFPCLIANDHPDWIVTVSARNGETTHGALDRLQYDVLQDPPDILYVQYGINDANKWADGFGSSRVMGPTFRANLREIILRSMKAGVRRIIVGTNHPITKEYSVDITCSFEEVNQYYNESIRMVCDDLGCGIIDHHGDTELLPDGVHLSERGHKAYYLRIKDRL